MYEEVVGNFDSFPAFVPIHGIVSANDGCQSDAIVLSVVVEELL